MYDFVTENLDSFIMPNGQVYINLSDYVNFSSNK